ncbi:polysaccharide pyruvyl transferase family protein [Roseospira navarrensis]|uniref:Polysaccharide pyruvyl transferase family protein n=1 Tax=Roseospira navarrensis TaxID=140058 RepID=A0A7X1ZBV9_9PROT|nr:polysaccharide pyruvyl transferase family protein [Roseospira navarrensis]MQX35463.1 polysaccharide pyruvyl transferase family protein [Roseospira navarrensis]
MTRRSLTIGLVWHSTQSPNLGLGALTVGHLAILDDLTARLGLQPRYRVIGVGDRSPTYINRADLTTKGLRTKDLVNPVGGLAGAVRACDVLLDIGGGDSFTDIYGAVRFRRMTWTKVMALLLGRPLVLSPQTIGPFEAGWSRRIAVAVMNRCRLVTTRDDLSTAYLRTLGVRAPAVEATDVALRLPFTAPERTPGDPVKVGLNVSGLLFGGGYTGKNQFGLAADYAAMMRRIVARFAAMEGVEVHLVSHVAGDHIGVEDDHTACRALASEVPGTVCVPPFPDPVAAKSYIAGLDFFAGARMHACIAAFSAGVPVVPMAYSRKFKGLFGSLGYDRVVDCRADSAETIEAALFDAFADRAALAAQVRAGAERGLARLRAYEDALTPILEEAAQR